MDPVLETLPENERVAKRAELTATIYAGETDEIKEIVRKALAEQVAKLEEGRAMLSKIAEPNSHGLDRDDVSK